MSEKYCAIPITLWSSTPTTVRTYSTLTRSLQTLSAPSFAVLSRASLEHMRTLDHHVDELLAGMPGVPGMPRMPDSARPSDGALQRESIRAELRRTLDDLADRGLLISESDLRNLLLREPSDRPVAAIQRVRITTLEQPDALAACLTTAAANARQYDRQVEFVILDDSRSHAAARPSVAWRLRKQIEPCTLTYVQNSHLARYCAELAATTGIDPRIVAFGLMPDENLRRTDGGNKNALILDSAGERYLQVDDDVQWRLGMPEGANQGLRIYAGREPMRTRYFRSREAVLASTTWKDVDFIGAHDAVLGRSVSSLATAAAPGDVSFFGETSQVLPSLLFHHEAQVRVTFTGLAGDAAMEFPSYRTLLEESRAAFVDSSDAYADLRLAREVLRVPTQLTIARPAWAMAYAIGCDASEMLPPFFPLGRSYEHALSVLLSRCWSTAYVGFLPVCVLHAPLNPRHYTDDALVRGVTALRLPDLVATLLASVPVEAFGPPADRLRRLGRYLWQLGEARLADLEEVLFAAVFANRSQQLNRHYRALAKYSGEPAWWARDVQSQIAALERLLDKPETGSLSDYPRLGANGNYSGVQSVLSDFGRFLDAWPALFEAASTLKRSGRSLRDLALADAS